MALAITLAFPQVIYADCGMASFYGKRHSGKTMANGKRFNPNKMTAAHKTLPLGSMIKVRYKSKSITVKITDRGPYIRGRKLDLSETAAKYLGFYNKGVAHVCYSH